MDRRYWLRALRSTAASARTAAEVAALRRLYGETYATSAWIAERVVQRGLKGAGVHFQFRRGGLNLMRREYADSYDDFRASLRRREEVSAKSIESLLGIVPAPKSASVTYEVWSTHIVFEDRADGVWGGRSFTRLLEIDFHVPLLRGAIGPWNIVVGADWLTKVFDLIPTFEELLQNPQEELKFAPKEASARGFETLADREIRLAAAAPKRT